MNADEIITQFLKTGELPESEIKIPKEKVTLKDGEFKIGIRDYYDAILNSDNPLNELDAEQTILIFANMNREEVEELKTAFLRILLYYPEKGIKFLESDNLNNAVFKEQDTTARWLMKFLVSMYLTVIHKANDLNITGELPERLLNYLKYNQKRLGELVDKLEAFQSQPEQIKPKPTTETKKTFKDLFRGKNNNAQKVKDILEQHHYTKNGIWSANKTSNLNHTGLKTELLAAYYSLRNKEGVFQQGKLTTQAKTFYKEFGLTAGKGKFISDRSLRNAPAPYHQETFDKLFKSIK